MTPALKSEIIGIVCHYLNIPYDVSLDPILGHEDRWATYCPIHEANRQGNPSLHVYVGLHSQTKAEEMHFKCMTRGCDPKRIKDCLERDGLLKKAKATTHHRNYEVNIPPHDEPDWEVQRFNEWPVTEHWAFLNLRGEVQFWHIRADNPNKKRTAKNPKSKTYSRIYSVTDKDTSRQFFVHSATLKEKAVPYNAIYLQQRLEAPVLIVEGPKTADAATRLFREYVVLTWDEGSSNFNKFDWSALQGRTSEIVLFPDNDEPGIKAMRGLAKILISMDLKPKIAFSEMLPAPYPEGWDLADPTPANAPDAATLFDDLEDIVFSDEEMKELKNNSVLSLKLEEYDNRFMPVLGGGDYYYYDIANPTMSSSAGCPYPLFKEKALYVNAPDKYLDEDSGTQEYCMDVWLNERAKVKTYNGLIYQPSTIDKTIEFGKNDYYLNLFTGFATKPIESNPEESQWFVNHLINLQGPEAAKYTLCYIADMIQNPGRKPGTMMLWVGTQGNGKSLVGKIIVRLLGHLNAVVLSADVLTDPFTTEYASKLFVMPEEVPTHVRAREAIERQLKFLITAENVRLNTKNSPAYQIPSYHRIILTANSIHGMNLDEDERRTTIIECKSDFLRKQNSMIADRAYFDPLFAKAADPIALGKLMHFLIKYEITMDVTKPFVTSAKQDHQRPKDPVQAAIEEILDTGTLPDYCNHLLQGWPLRPVLLPRSLIARVVHDYCETNRIAIPSAKAIGSVLMHLIPPVSFSKMSVKSFELFDSKGVITSKLDRTVELLEINEHRRFYEDVTNRRPNWQAVDSHEVATENMNSQLGEDTNVVPLKGKSKNKDDSIL